MAGLLLLASGANAHPMGNFSINHYARFEAQGGQLLLRYIVDYAEIPTAERREQLDANNDGTVSEPEKTAFLNSETANLAKNLSLTINSKAAPLQIIDSRLDLQPGAAGLNTLRVLLNFQSEMAPEPQKAHRIPR